MRTMFRALIATLSDHRRQIGVFFFSTALLVGVFFLVPTLVHAAPGDGSIDTNGIGQDLGLLFGNICLRLTEIIGKLLLFVMDTFLVPIAGYNGFTTAPAVQHGWIILRDLTNMFFVLMMLVISIGTILGIEEFSYRRLLPRLLIMAVVINFSKVIVGIFIDFSQVVMLTFVNGFSAAAGGNMIALLRLKDTVDISEGLPGDKLDIWDFVGAQFLGLIMLFTALMIIVVMCMMLAFRIVMLWILTILSPLVFFLSTVQKGKAQQAYAQWWDKLGTYLVSGPVLAFFLWLAFSVAGGEGLTANFDTNGELSEVGKTQQYFVNAAGSRESLVGYIVGVAMLLGGMYITADFGAMGGSMLRSGADFVGKTAPRALGRFAYRNTAGRAANLADRGATRAEELWFANTHTYLPFSKRKEDYKKAIRAKRAEDATTTGLLGRNATSQRSMLKVQGQAADAAGVAAKATQQRDAMLLPALRARARAEDVEKAMPQEEFTMNAAGRASLRSTRGVIQQRLETARALGNGADEATARRQLEEIDSLAAAPENARVRWDATVLQGIKASLQDEAQRLRSSADGQENAVRGSDAFKQAEDKKQRADDVAKKTADKAKAARADFATNPDTRFTKSAIAKTYTEAREGLSKMDLTERMAALRDAFQGKGEKDKFRFKAVWDEMAAQGEIDDVLNSDILGEKFGTNFAGIERFHKVLSEKKGIGEQEALGLTKQGFDIAATKGQHMFRGVLVTDVTSGAIRMNTPFATNMAQANKLDEIEIEDFWKKNQSEGVVVTDKDGNRRLIDAMVEKLASTQDKFVDLLKDNKVNAKNLEALKGALEQLREEQQRNIITKEVVDKIAAATTRRTSSAADGIRRRGNA